MTQRLLIGIEPTGHCNLNCSHCLRADTRTHSELPLDTLRSIFDQARAYHRPHIALTGGEPTLHSEFFGILDLIAERDFTCNIATDGLGFPELASRLKNYPVLSVSFSLDGAEAETHDAIRGKGTYRKVLLAIGMARYLGFKVTVQMAVHRKNIGEIEELQRLCQQLGVHTLFVSHTQPTERLYAAKLQLTPEEWLEVESTLEAIVRTKPAPHPQLSVGAFNPGMVAPCMTLQHRSLNIDHRGRLTFCCQLSGVASSDDDVIANLDQTSLRDAHRQLLDSIHQVLTERLHLDGRLDGFQCWHCYKRFGKLDWMSAYPTDAWVRADSELRCRIVREVG